MLILEILNKILKKEIVPIEVKITECDGDGYQFLITTYVDKNQKVNKQVLASHFDIEKVSSILRENNIKVSGSFTKK